MDDYRVRLDAFEGPLDLLLHLIRRAEVDVTTISLGAIADQFLDHVSRIGEVDVDGAGEFLVTAATLVELKSRLVSPSDPEADEAGGGRAPGREADDPGAELVRQLLMFRRVRDAAAWLDARRLDWSSRWPAARSGVQALPESADEPDLDLEDLGIYDLAEAYRRIIDTVILERLGAHEVSDDETPIELHAADLLERLAHLPAETGGGPARLSIHEVFKHRTRSEVIGLFLAMLELAKQRRIEVRQNSLLDDVSIVLASTSDEALVHGDAPSDRIL